MAKQGASSSPVPDRTDWLDPDKDDDSPLLVGRTENVDVQVQVRKASSASSSHVQSNAPSKLRAIADSAQIDESWLMTSDELAALEADFALEEP